MKVTRGNRLHIGFYGKRNVGKSTLFNLILGQDYSITSVVAGTTTDVNIKSMELPPVGPVTLMDCAGIDDIQELGQKRVEKTLKTLERADIAVYVYEGELDFCDRAFLSRLKEMKIPYFMVNKVDFSHGEGFIEEFKAKLVKILPEGDNINLLPESLKKGDVAVLVIPIDKEAPAGRLILPQVQTLRAMLDEHCISVICREDELARALKMDPKIVITDSQAFKKVDEIVPRDVALTSFSILFANFKGNLGVFVEGSKVLDRLDELKSGDKILILESCTHHAIEDDIGKVKIPRLVQKYTGIEPVFEHYSGFDMPKNLSDYKLIIHCGACMTSRTEVLRRIELAREAGVAITNYGVVIAKCLGILERAVTPFATHTN